jgi:hypothetical protein
MENLSSDSVAALVLRLVAISFLYVVNIFYSSYKYNRKLAAHYSSLKACIKLSRVTKLNEIKDFCNLFETIKADKIEFEEGKIPDKLLELLKKDDK